MYIRVKTCGEDSIFQDKFDIITPNKPKNCDNTHSYKIVKIGSIFL